MQLDKKISFYLPSLRGGGAERSMLNLAQGFANRGYLVDLVLAKAEGPYLSLVPDNVQIVDLRASRVLKSLPGLVCYLRREQPQAMLSAMGHANLIALWAKRISNVPVRLGVTIRNTTSISIKHGNYIRSKMILLFSKWFYESADSIIAVSKGVADDLSQFACIHRTKISVIYNPVVTNDLMEKAKEVPEHPWFNDQYPPVVLGVGRLSKQKDFGSLINAFALVREKKSARLVILGEGDERANLETQIDDLGLEHYADLPGFVDNPFAYMSRACVFVLSSAWEGLPGVLIQAMACGVPVVSTDCPSGPREILEEGKWGKLIPVGDIYQMANAIESALNGDKVDARERAIFFNEETIVDEYIHVLNLENR
ncbi:glycosyltransferase [Desulfovermiculus halophilus]|uniref:glycosyltransferase n=1 Tax=Desulfovermiculus halophilus TaxID=339722 RepID=UPI00055071AC|nr:glycosyltransferase [Desulfovermiculus halophilus]